MPLEQFRKKPYGHTAYSRTSKTGKVSYIKPKGAKSAADEDKDIATTAPKRITIDTSFNHKDLEDRTTAKLIKHVLKNSHNIEHDDHLHDVLYQFLKKNFHHGTDKQRHKDVNRVKKLFKDNNVIKEHEPIVVPPKKIEPPAKTPKTAKTETNTSKFLNELGIKLQKKSGADPGVVDAVQKSLMGLALVIDIKAFTKHLPMNLEVKARCSRSNFLAEYYASPARPITNSPFQSYNPYSQNSLLFGRMVISRHGKESVHHEFGHYLDNAMAKHKIKSPLTSVESKERDNEKPFMSHWPSTEAGAWISAVKKTESYQLWEAGIVGPNRSAYLRQPTEMFARFFDMWVEHKLEEKGHNPLDYFANAHGKMKNHAGGLFRKEDFKALLPGFEKLIAGHIKKAFEDFTSDMSSSVEAEPVRKAEKYPVPLYEEQRLDIQNLIEKRAKIVVDELALRPHDTLDGYVGVFRSKLQPFLFSYSASQGFYYKEARDLDKANRMYDYLTDRETKLSDERRRQESLQSLERWLDKTMKALGWEDNEVKVIKALPKKPQEKPVKQSKPAINAGGKAAGKGGKTRYGYGAQGKEKGPESAPDAPGEAKAPEGDPVDPAPPEPPKFVDPNKIAALLQTTSEVIKRVVKRFADSQKLGGRNGFIKFFQNKFPEFLEKHKLTQDYLGLLYDSLVRELQAK